jgi:ribose 5-phosphate isomerase B
MKIFIGTDHAGFGLKEILVPYLKNQGHEVVDKGALTYDEHDDYPDFIIPVAQEVSRNPDGARGIVFGATGQGEAIAANKFPHVRAIVYYGKSECVVDDDSDVIVRSREHNNANILSLGARYLKEDEMLQAVTLWLNTPFGDVERHVRRLAKIDEINQEKLNK